MYNSAGFQDYHGKETGSFLPSLTCGGERVLGQGHQEGHYLPTGGKKVCQEVNKTLHSPAWHNQPDVKKKNILSIPCANDSMCQTCWQHLHCIFYRELYTLMKDQDDGVKELKLEQENRVFNHCFTGIAVIAFYVIIYIYIYIFFNFLFTILTTSLFLHRCNSGRMADLEGKSKK